MYTTNYVNEMWNQDIYKETANVYVARFYENWSIIKSGVTSYADLDPLSNI